MVLKKTFLLFEILIALSLMGMLMAFLFSFLVQGVKVEKKIAHVREILLERQHAHICLQELFSSLTFVGPTCPIATVYDPKEKTQELSFTFDHGVDPDPVFGGVIEGKIYLDEKKNLLFIYGPAPLDLEGVWRKEVLFPCVSAVSFRFLSEQDVTQFAKPLRAKVQWKEEWSKETKQIPSIIRMVITKDEETLYFAFRLPEVHPIPTWSES